MKLVNSFLLVIFAITFSNCNQTPVPTDMEDKPATSTREYYQLKVYSFDSETQEKTTDKFLSEAYLPALGRLGIAQVGVFKLRPQEGDTTKKTFVLIPFSSFDQFISMEDDLAKDKDYLNAGSDYLQAQHDDPPYNRIESTMLKAFVDMPNMKASPLKSPRSNRVYELRSYESSTEQLYVNKVDMFNAGGEIKLFDELEFNAVFYAEVVSGAKMPNLMYMTTFADQESRDAHWKSFVEAPAWNALKVMPKYQNNVSHIDITFLYPTEYSAY